MEKQQEIASPATPAQPTCIHQDIDYILNTNLSTKAPAKQTTTQLRRHVAEGYTSLWLLQDSCPISEDIMQNPRNANNMPVCSDQYEPGVPVCDDASDTRHILPVSCCDCVAKEPLRRNWCRLKTCLPYIWMLMDVHAA